MKENKKKSTKSTKDKLKLLINELLDKALEDSIDEALFHKIQIADLAIKFLKIDTSEDESQVKFFEELEEKTEMLKGGSLEEE